ncbi:MAG: sugar phosphate isomerase/epimerase [Chloroflexi bacterium]|nr:sugar phosphate isomerase/epimerase [Chloroflexota bacterium]
MATELQNKEDQVRLGIDSYSVREQGWDAFQIIDYAATLNLDNVHFSERGNFASLDRSYLTKLRDYAAERGLTIEVGMGSFERFAQSFKPELGSGEQQLSDMLDAAVVVGSPVVRCFLGMEVDRHGSVPLSQHIDEAVRTLRAVASKAKDCGVKVAVENHGGVDLLARELREIVETVGFDAVGVCLDTGNPAYGGEDPVVSASLLAPYVVTSHFRDTRVWCVPQGAMVQWSPLGWGNVDLEKILGTLEMQHRDIPIDLEIITGRPPKLLAYFDDASVFWNIYPTMLAKDFAHFVRLAETGKPGPIEQVTLDWSNQGDDTTRQRFREQQLAHFQASVQYARKTLGLGGRR